MRYLVCRGEGAHIAGYALPASCPVDRSRRGPHHFRGPWLITGVFPQPTLRWAVCSGYDVSAPGCKVERYRVLWRAGAVPIRRTCTP